MTKYHNKKVVIDGIKFDSAKEGRRYQELKLMERAGEITDLQRQVKFVLAPSVVIAGRKKPDLMYTADYTYFQGGVLVVEDSKSKATLEDRAFGIRRHLMKSVHNIDLLIT